MRVFDLLVALSSFCLVACGSSGDEPSSGPAGTGGTGATSTSTVSTGGMGGGEGGAPPSGDGNDSCAEAVALEETSPGRFTGSGSISDSDRDYFTFQAQAGQWFQVRVIPTQAGSFNTVTRVFDDGAQLVATGEGLRSGGDEFAPSMDSKVYFRAVSAGTYCVEALGENDWLGQPSTIPSAPAVEVEVVPLDPSFTLWNEDVEPNDELTQPQTGVTFASTDGNQRAYIAGVFDDVADVDVYRLVIEQPSYLNVNPFPAGPGAIGESGYGFDQPIGRVLIHDDQQNLVAEMEPGLVPLGARYCEFYRCGLLWPFVPAGNYTLSIERGPGPSTGNDAYGLFFFTRVDTGPGVVTPIEGTDGFLGSDDGTNDVPSGAEMTFPAPGFTFFVGTLPEGDVDHWQLVSPFDLSPGDELELDCKSWSIGSGVRGLEVTLIDGGGVAADRVGTETAGLGVVWNDRADELGVSTGSVVVSQSQGPHYIRLRNDASVPDASAVSLHYMCNVRKR